MHAWTTHQNFQDGKSNYLGLFLAEITCAGFLQTCGQHKFNLVFVRIAEPGFLILAPLYLSFCSIEHNYIFFSWTLRDHEEFKVKINVLVETAPTVPEEVQNIHYGTPWPVNNVCDHPAMNDQGEML